eukprot:4393373-Pyramimonas_sp.AAC.1
MCVYAPLILLSPLADPSPHFVVSPYRARVRARANRRPSAPAPRAAAAASRAFRAPWGIPCRGWRGRKSIAS